MQVWILTFNRPQALNRQINTFGASTAHDIHIFSNHPEVRLTEENSKRVKSVTYNTLSDPEANSYCARSWNNIFIKAFKDNDDAMFVQDDTAIHPNISNLIRRDCDKYDLIWGPAGDTFFYMKKKVLATVGWFDERYLGCYCGDADFLKRCFMFYDKSKLSIAETHDWGFIHNDIGIRSLIATDIGSKAIDETYVNQHHEIENITGVNTNYILNHSQGHFKAKWQTPGNGINGIGPITNYMSPPAFPEIDWYPWFTTKYLRG
jgi:hypothetical protein